MIKNIGICLFVLVTVLINSEHLQAQDTDSDGVVNYLDLDDDNDGILDTDEGCGKTTDIVGTIGPWSSVPNGTTYSLDGTDLTYTRSGSYPSDVVAYDNIAQGRTIRFESNPISNGTLTLTFSNPISSVDFKIIDFDQFEDFTVNVYDENNILYDLTSEGVISVGSMINQTGNQFVATSSTNSGGTNVFGNDPAQDYLGSVLFYFVGKVSKIEIIHAQPETSSASFTQPTFCSTDTDNDGFFDHVDTDSDDDTCVDADEAYNADGTDVDYNGMYGSGNPAVDIDGKVYAATYPGTNAAVTNSSSMVCAPKFLESIDDYISTPTNFPIEIDVLNNELGEWIDAASVVTEGGLSQPTKGSIQNINGTTGAITYLPENNFSGLDSFEYKVCNSGGITCDTAKVFVTISCVDTINQNNIYGTVFQDGNENGIYANDEKGKEGITVNLYEDNSPKDNIPDGAAVQTTTTDSLGNYQFGMNSTYTSLASNVEISGGCQDAEDTDEYSTDLTFGFSMYVGLRFSGISIPSGAIVDSAFLYVTSNQNSISSTGTVDIYAEDVLNSVDYCSNNNVNHSSRPKTTSLAIWDINSGPDWITDVEYQSSDIKSVVEELLASYNYSNGTMNFIMTSNGLFPRNAKSYETNNDGTHVPRLVIHYKVPGINQYNYIVKTNINSFETGDTLTTDSIQYVTFDSNGTSSCENNFGMHGTDTDQDGITDLEDADDDNDGIPDEIEICGVSGTDYFCLSSTGCDDCDPSADDDSDGILNYKDPDFCTLNSEGVCETMDMDFDGIPNHLDLDSDNDGIPDLIEAGGKDISGNGVVDYPTTTNPMSMLDADGDGLDDTYDDTFSNGSNMSWTAGVAIPNLDSDGDGFANALDLDADNDGISDVVEAGGVDNNGDGFIDNNTDVDLDGFTDVFDPDDDGVFGTDSGEDNQPLVITDALLVLYNSESLVKLDRDGDGLPDYLDLDSDNDGLPDLIEVKGIDTNGDGRVDIVTDADEDGFADIYDTQIGGVAPLGSPTSSLLKTSGTDTDADGKADDVAIIYVDGNNLTTDSDGDGLSDHIDLDSDNDGIPDLIEIGGHDLEGDGRVDISGSPWDTDGDGFSDLYDITDGGLPLLKTTADTDRDGKSRSIGEQMITGEGGGIPPNPDEDSVTNHLDIDSDNDGILDVKEAGGIDFNNDGRYDDGAGGFTDVDNDGLADEVDGDVGNDFMYENTNPLITTGADDAGDINTRLEYSGNGTSDSDLDDVPNFLDIDSDNDGIYDNYEAQSTEGYIPPTTGDSDGDGLLNVYDINASALQNGLTPFNFNQSSGDTTPDYLDLDSDGDGISDEQEAWDNVADGDSQYDNLLTSDKTDTDGDGLVNCYDGNTINASAFAWVGDPADDVNGPPTGTVFTDDLSVILPSNDANNPNQPDYRSGINACAIAQVYYGVSEASGGTSTSYQYDSATKKHVNGVSSGVIRSTAFCEPDGDGWFYFYNPLEPENYLMGVKANYSGGTVNASAFWKAVDYLEIKLEEDRTKRHKIGPSEATLALERDWALVLKDTFQTGTTFDIKFYFTQAEMNNLDAAADVVEANATSATRTFEWIEKAGGLQNSDITPSGVTGENDITAFDLAGINEANPGLTDGTNGSVGNGKNYVQFSGLTSFVGGTGVIKLSYASVLPVELSSFSAREKDCRIQLNWTTETEEDFDYFEVQKSRDGQVFKTIKTIQGQGGNIHKQYSLNNINASGVDYFRLKMVDLDQSIKYSNIISLTSSCLEKIGLNVYPNPIGSQGGILNVDFLAEEEVTKIIIMDALGRTIKGIVLDSEIGEINNAQIDVSDLPIGTFSLRLTNTGEAKLFVKRQ